MNQIMREFIIGSSVSIFQLFYVGIAYSRLNSEEKARLKLSYGYLTAILPIFYGLTYVILNENLKPFIKNQRVRLFILGGIAGEFYSLVGHFGLQIPETIFKSKSPNLVHIIAPIMYSIIYGVWIDFVEKSI